MRSLLAALLLVLLVACSGGDAADTDTSEDAVDDSADVEETEESEDDVAEAEAELTPTPPPTSATGELTPSQPGDGLGSLMGGAQMTPVEDPSAIISCSAAELLISARDGLDQVDETSPPALVEQVIQNFSDAVDIAGATVLSGPLTQLVTDLRDSLDDVIAYLQSQGFDPTSLDTAPPEVLTAVEGVVEATEGLITGLSAGCEDIDPATEAPAAPSGEPAYCNVLIQLDAVLSVDTAAPQATFIAAFAVLSTTLDEVGDSDPAAAQILLDVIDYFAAAEAIFAEYDYDVDAAEADPRLGELDTSPLMALVDLVERNCPPGSLGG